MKHEEDIVVELPGGRTGLVRLRVDTARLARSLGWWAYFNKGKESTLGRRKIVARLIEIREPAP